MFSLVYFEVVLDRNKKKESVLTVVESWQKDAITNTEASVCEYCRPHLFIEKVHSLRLGGKRYTMVLLNGSLILVSTISALGCVGINWARSALHMPGCSYICFRGKRLRIQARAIAAIPGISSAAVSALLSSHSHNIAQEDRL